MCLRILRLDFENLLPSENRFVPQLRFSRSDCKLIILIDCRLVRRDCTTQQCQTRRNEKKSERTASQQNKAPFPELIFYINLIRSSSQKRSLRRHLIFGRPAKSGRTDHRGRKKRTVYFLTSRFLDCRYAKCMIIYHLG